MTKPEAGHFSWSELMTDDENKSGDFYQKLFGWHIVPFLMPDDKPAANGYKVFKTDPNKMGIAGMIKCPFGARPSQWVPYVIVDSTDIAVVNAKKLGAEILLEPIDVPTVGRIAVIQDPRGAIIGVHQPAM